MNYDDDTWASISESLQSDETKIHQSSRAQLLSDALSLAREGTLGYESALPVTEYLVDEVRIDLHLNT